MRTHKHTHTQHTHTHGHEKCFWFQEFETFILVLINPLAGQQFTCEVIEGICVEGQYPDPISCAHYHVCTQSPITGCLQDRQRCPELMAFDRIQRQCVFGGDARCDGEIIFNLKLKLTSNKFKLYKDLYVCLRGKSISLIKLRTLCRPTCCFILSHRQQGQTKFNLLHFSSEFSVQGIFLMKLAY